MRFDRDLRADWGVTTHDLLVLLKSYCLANFEG